MMQPLNHDLCLVATSEAAMIVALSTKTTNEETGETQSNNVFHDGKNWVSATHDWQLVPIGKVQTTFPVMNTEGQLITPDEFDDRFHMNVLCNDTVFAKLQAFDHTHFEETAEHLIIEPTNRKVVWAK